MNCTLTKNIVFFAFCSIMLWGHCSILLGNADEQRLIRTIMDDYKWHVGSLKRVEFRFEENDPKREKASNTSSLVGKFKYDGKSFYFQQESSGSYQYERLVVDQDYYVTVLNEIDKPQLTVLSVRDFNSLGDEVVLKYNFGPYRTIWGETRFTQSGNAVNFCSLDTASMELRRDAELFVLRSFLEKDGGFLEMAFTLQKGKYRLKKITFTRTQMTGNPPNMDYYSYEVENYIEAGGTYFPSQFVVEMKIPKGKFIGKTGENVSPGFNLITQHNITDFKVNDSVETIKRTFQTQIPNNTRVHMQDVPQIKYVWLDGKIVPWTDELALAAVRGHKFIPGVRTVQFWLIALGSVLILLGIGVNVWKYVKSRNNNDTQK